MCESVCVTVRLCDCAFVCLYDVYTCVHVCATVRLYDGVCVCVCVCVNKHGVYVCVRCVQQRGWCAW